MKHVKLFEAFSTPSLTEDQKVWLDKCTTGIWNLNSSTGLVDVDGDFKCSSQGLKELKGVKFGKVSGNFYCYENQLTTLEGAPQTVNGFYCYGNQLTTLEGAPQTVKGSFYCSENQLTTLEGAPQTVKWSFNCDGNQLTTLEGAPQTVGGGFNCERNQLTTLVGAPQTVNRNFYCDGNPVSEETLKSIFSLMKSGKSYQQALEKCWPKMGDEDRALMYKQIPDLSPEEARKYKALATVNRIKNYL